jgi:hypothetical protein
MIKLTNAEVQHRTQSYEIVDTETRERGRLICVATKIKLNVLNVLFVTYFVTSEFPSAYKDLFINILSYLLTYILT